jgi:hypothetical protein
MEWMRWAGLALQLVGLFMALAGLRRTRLAYSPDEPGALDFVAVPLKHGWWATAEFIRVRVFRRRPRYRLVATPIAERWSAEPLPWKEERESPIDPALSVAEQLRLLDERTRFHHVILNYMDRDVTEDRKEIERVQTRIGEAEETLRAHADEGDRRLAVNGLRGSAWGLFVTLLGTILAAFGS